MGSTVSSYDMDMSKKIMDSEKLQRRKGKKLFIYSLLIVCLLGLNFQLAGFSTSEIHHHIKLAAKH